MHLICDLDAPIGPAFCYYYACCGICNGLYSANRALVVCVASPAWSAPPAAGWRLRNSPVPGVDCSDSPRGVRQTALRLHNERVNDSCMYVCSTAPAAYACIYMVNWG